jgi:hypothetical protein
MKSLFPNYYSGDYSVDDVKNMLEHTAYKENLAASFLQPLKRSAPFI